MACLFDEPATCITRLIPATQLDIGFIANSFEDLNFGVHHLCRRLEALATPINAFLVIISHNIKLLTATLMF
jgi:hypothetical protein